MSTTAERPRRASGFGSRERYVDFSAKDVKAPFALRTGALFIDYILVIAVPVIALLIERLLPGDGPAGSGIGGTSILLMALICVANFLLLPALSGQSVGKMLTGLRIVDKDGGPASGTSIVIRHTAGYIFTLLTFGLGYIVGGLNPSGRTLHDLVAGTTVIYAQKRLI